MSDTYVADATNTFIGPEDRERMRKAEVLARFDTFEVGEDQISALIKSRELFQAAAQFILNASHSGREQALALTALEEAKYWTNQSIAKDGVPA